ncbi:CpsD/CapB family tyrosine-protein kinase [Neobacillus sp. LXY-1]|uniref:CpsD/CapB family tyrosine-protein kinase n=1 Tax=Neobacillus sp. LXY-1 TaxID=3379133 RepID=UPI003EE3BE80
MAVNKRKESTDIKKRTIITYSHPESRIAEQFRMIQTNIKFMLSGKKSQTFLVTSPCGSEGKSTIITNLAVSMAQQKKKVLLIDANLRKPALHSFFKLPNTNGLTDVLTGRQSFTEAVYHTEIWRLDLLTSGLITHNPVELLSSQQMLDLLDKVKQQYDVILIDSNAVLEVSDSKLVANQSDGVILVVKNDHTKFEDAIEAKKVLELAKAHIVGVVVNK